MSFATPPTAPGENSITMTATTATDINGVEYYFDCTVGGGPDSGWQSSPVFTATGLTPGHPIHLRGPRQGLRRQHHRRFRTGIRHHRGSGHHAAVARDDELRHPAHRPRHRRHQHDRHHRHRSQRRGILLRGNLRQSRRHRQRLAEQPDLHRQRPRIPAPNTPTASAPATRARPQTPPPGPRITSATTEVPDTTPPAANPMTFAVARPPPPDLISSSTRKSPSAPA